MPDTEPRLPAELDPSRVAIPLPPGVKPEDVELCEFWQTALAYWFDLIDPELAAAILNVVLRSLEKWRQEGGGPEYIRISSRCIRYRRIDLWSYCQERLQRSTAEDPTPEIGDDNDLENEGRRSW